MVHPVPSCAASEREQGTGGPMLARRRGRTVVEVSERLLGVLIAAVLTAGVVGAATAGEDDSSSDDPLAALAPAVRDNLRWVLAYVNGGVGAEQISERFTTRFLDQVSPEQLEALTRTQIRPAGPFRATRVEDHSATSAAVLIAGRTVTLRVEIAVESQQIAGLLFQPAQEHVPPLESWDDLDRRLEAHAGHVAVLAAEIVGGECRPLHALDADRPLPLASAFKLYVLGALSLDVEAGRAGWDEPVTITDEHRVHSSAHHGTTPTDTEVPLRDLAGSMISVSDNTATDHVMARIGRDAVEAVLGPMGMAEPDRNRPFLTTAELTRLKFLGDTALSDEYATAGEARRRVILRDLPTGPVTDEALLATSPTSPTAVDTVEWFGSPMDLCRAHAWLAARDEVVQGILTQNPGAGLDLNRARWPTIAFKGGSEPGVLALTWRLDRADGRVFAVSALLMDTNHDIDPAAVLDVVETFDLLATT
jgi:beta-lactamase class A